MTSRSPLSFPLGALFGGVLGSKLPMIILYWREMLDALPDFRLLISSRSIVGGLAGGAAGVFLVKKWLGISGRRGNLFVPGIAAGVAIGRLGCFLRGCCFGKPTDMRWGVDFGDGILRHPTQIYEALFMVVVLGWGLVAWFGLWAPYFFSGRDGVISPSECCAASWSRFLRLGHASRFLPPSLIDED